MSAVKVGCRSEADEELAAIRVLSRICHWQDSRSSVFEGKVFVVEPLPVDWLTPCAIVVSEVPTLCHKSGNDPVELRAFEMKRPLWLLARTLFTCAQRSKVIWGFGSVIEQVHDNSACWFFIDRNFEEDSAVESFFLRCRSFT